MESRACARIRDPTDFSRIVNYLKALIEDERTDVLITAYQGKRTVGRKTQNYADKHSYVKIDEQRYTVNAGVYTLSGYSAHADQTSLIRFVRR